jgi:large subunit ribosomal protein L30
MSTSLKVTQFKSKNGSDKSLRRIGHSVEVKDSPQMRGMLHKVRHLVEVEDA